MNPVVLIQLMQQYANYETGIRTFAFMKNKRLKVHRETEEEVRKRKSILPKNVREAAYDSLWDKLKETMKGRIDKHVWVDSNMYRIAVPIETSSAQTGYGVLPTGSRVKIPEGKVVRAFTYWEKVNDIDLSCFALNEDGSRDEFSWRTMWTRQSNAVAFSGDVTDGYDGGSEYLDINISAFQREHPKAEYIIFCDNVFSDKHFKEVECRAGFMTRKEMASGEVFEPKTVQTSFRITCDSTFAYLFGIDLNTREMVWLNVARDGNMHVAGSGGMDFLRKHFKATNVISMGELYAMAGMPVLDEEHAEVLVTDKYGALTEKDGKEIVRSCDFEKVLKLLAG